MIKPRNSDNCPKSFIDQLRSFVQSEQVDSRATSENRLYVSLKGVEAPTHPHVCDQRIGETQFKLIFFERVWSSIPDPLIFCTYETFIFRIKTRIGSYDKYIEFNWTKNYKMNKLKLFINRCYILINTCIDLSGTVSFQSLELCGF